MWRLQLSVIHVLLGVAKTWEDECMQWGQKSAHECIQCLCCDMNRSGGMQHLCLGDC